MLAATSTQHSKPKEIITPPTTRKTRAEGMIRSLGAEYLSPKKGSPFEFIIIDLYIRPKKVKGYLLSH